MSFTTLAFPATDAQSVVLGSANEMLTDSSFSSSSNLPPAGQKNPHQHFIEWRTPMKKEDALSVLAMNWKTKPWCEAGLIMREWREPSDERVVSIANLASLMMARTCENGGCQRRRDRFVRTDRRAYLIDPERRERSRGRAEEGGSEEEKG